MTFFLIAASFGGSLLFTLLLRRLDRSSMKLNRIHRYGEIQKQQLESYVVDSVRSIKDATLEFETMLHQSRQLQSDLSSNLEKYKEKLVSVAGDQDVIEAIAREMESIAESTKNVTDRTERIDIGLEKLSHAEENILSIRHGLENLNVLLEDKEREIEGRLEDFQDAVAAEAKERASLLLNEIKDESAELVASFQNMSRKIEEGSSEAIATRLMVENLRNQLDEKWQDGSAHIEEKWILETGRLEEKFGTIENKLIERFRSLETGLTAIRTTAVESLQGEVSKIRSDLDGFNLSAISKRDEILNETRRMAEKMGDQISLFQEKYIEAENKLMKFADQEKQALRDKMISFEEEWTEMEERRISSVEDKILGLESSIDKIRDREIQGMGEEMERFRDEFKKNIQEAQLKIDGKSLQIEESLRNIAREEEKNLGEIRDELNEIQESMTDYSDELRHSIKAETDHSIEMLRDSRKSEESSILKAKEELGGIRDQILNRMDDAEEHLRNASKIRQKIEDYAERAGREIEETRDSVLGDLEKRALQYFSIQDEKVGSLEKTIDGKISEHLTSLAESGHFKIDELKKRTTESIRDAAIKMEGDLDHAREEFRKIRDDVKKEMDQGRNLRDDIFKELATDKMRLQKFEERLNMFDQAQDLTEKLDETLEVLTDRLDLAREENSKISEYVSNLETVRHSRKELEKELKLLEDQRGRLSETENSLSKIDSKVNDLQERLSLLSAGELMADRIEERLITLNEYKDSFEKFFMEMTDKKKYIENAIRFIEKSKQQVKEAKDSAEKLIQKVDRAEIRQDDMEKYLQEMESKTNLLNHMDAEIQKVEARFEQMEGLMKDMENRQKQIGVMNRRMEDIKSEGEELKIEMESVISESEEKMERLTSFYQTIEKMIDSHQEEAHNHTDQELLLSASTSKKTQSGVADWKREGILSLYLNHKWEPDLIADRMKMDPAVVRAVISSHR